MLARVPLERRSEALSLHSNHEMYTLAVAFLFVWAIYETSVQ